MKRFPVALLLTLFFVFDSQLFAGGDRVTTHFTREQDFNAPSFEISTESAYILGCFGNPHAYELATQFVTARLRWGAVHNEDSWLHGYNQVYLLAMGEYFARGLENHYFGINAGFRYNFLRPGSRFTPYVSGGVGLGAVDATRDRTPGALGQNFTFNILTAIGVSYHINDHWSATGGVLYEHLSNAGLSEPERPNSSLNAVGPQLGVTYSF